MKMNWECKIITIIISLISLSILIIAFDDFAVVIKGYLFATILLVAGYIDLKTKTIPNYIHVLIILVGLINIKWVYIFQSIIGLFVVPLPFLIVSILKENSIGGGDIKLMGAGGFFLGMYGGFLASIIGLLIAVIINGIYYRIKNKDKTISFALAPYLGIALVFVYIMPVI